MAVLSLDHFKVLFYEVDEATGVYKRIYKNTEQTVSL